MKPTEIALAVWAQYGRYEDGLFSRPTADWFSAGLLSAICNGQTVRLFAR